MTREEKLRNRRAGVKIPEIAGLMRLCMGFSYREMLVIYREFWWRSRSIILVSNVILWYPRLVVHPKAISI